MKRRRWSFLIVTTMLLAFVFACGDNQPSDTSSTVKPVPNAVTTPKVAKPLTEEEVKVVYHNNCVSCHAEDGKGRKDNAPSVPDLTDAQWQKQRTDEDFIRAIAKGKGSGKGAMPKWDRLLSPEEITAVTKYVRTFAK